MSERQESYQLGCVGTLQRPFAIRKTKTGKMLASSEVKLAYPPTGIPRFMELTLWEPDKWFEDHDETWLRRFEQGSMVGLVGAWKWGRSWVSPAGEEKPGKPVLSAYWISQEGWRKPQSV